MQKFDIVYRVSANNADQALATFDAAYLTRLCDFGVDLAPLARLGEKSASHARMLGMEALPVHKASKPDFYLPEEVYCYYVREERVDIGRDDKVHTGMFPFACVVFGRDIKTGKWVRGISICSETEPKGFDRVEAKRKAYERAVSATNAQACIRGDRIRLTKYATTAKFISLICEGQSYTPADIVYKAGYDVLLSEYECRLVKSRKDRHDVGALPCMSDIEAKKIS